MIYLETLKISDDIFNTDLSICDEICNLTFDHPSEFLTNQGIRMNRFNDFIDKALEVQDESENDLKRINNKINETLQRNAKLEKELEELNGDLSKFKIELREIEKIDITAEQLAAIEMLKCKIKLYKLLTNTIFSHENQSIKGYIQNRTNLAEFDFNKTKLTPEQMNRYWIKLETNTGIDCKQIAKDVLDL